jgi:serine/threonine protein kinase
VDETLKSLEDTRVTSAQTGRVTWQLMRVAGIDPGDAIVRNDQVRYSLIGTTMLLMAAFGVFGWSCFLVLCGLLDAVPGVVGVLLMLLIATTLVGAVVAFDRGQTSHTNAGLELMKADGIIAIDSAAPTAEARQRERANALLHATAPMRIGPFAWRVLLALAIAGVFSLSGESVFLGKDVQVQQIKEQVAKDNAQIEAAETTVKEDEANYVAKRKQYELQLKQAQASSHAARVGQHPPGSKCFDSSTECYKRQRAADQANKSLVELQDPIREPNSGASVADAEIASARSEITQLRAHPGRVSAHAGGPLAHFNALISSLKHQTGAIIVWILLTSVLLALDLGALIAKWGARLTLYEHRQAQRARLLHANVTHALYIDDQVREARRRERGEGHILEVERDLDRKRTEASEQHAAEEAARAGAESAVDDPTVREQARERALEELKFHLRRMPSHDGWRSEPPPANDGTGVDDDWLPPDLDIDPGQMRIEPLRATAVLEGKGSRYRLDKLIHGTPAVVEVWQATDLATDTEVIVKIHYAPMHNRDPSYTRRRRRAVNEIKVTEKLEGFHIVQFLDGAIDPDDQPYPFIVTPRYADGDLEAKWNGERERDVLDVVEIGLQLLDALKMNALVHGDIKPSNIIVDHVRTIHGVAVSNVRLIDWELARDPFSVHAVEWLPRGTRRYSAPQVREQSMSADFRDDLYSVAAVIWRGCTGSPPGTAELGEVAEGNDGDVELRRLARRRERGDPTVRQLNQLCPSVPGNLSMLAGRWLSYSRELRVGGPQDKAIAQAERELGRIADELREKASRGEQTIVGQIVPTGVPTANGASDLGEFPTSNDATPLHAHPGYGGQEPEGRRSYEFKPGGSRGRGAFRMPTSMDEAPAETWSSPTPREYAETEDLSRDPAWEEPRASTSRLRRLLLIAGFRFGRSDRDVDDLRKITKKRRRGRWRKADRE